MLPNMLMVQRGPAVGRFIEPFEGDPIRIEGEKIRPHYKEQLDLVEAYIRANITMKPITGP